MPKQQENRIILAVTSDASLVLLGEFPRYLAVQGWDVHIVCAPGEKAADYPTGRGVSLHTIPMRRDPSPLHDLKSLFSWITLLRRIRPGVISYGTPKAALLGAISGFLCRIPFRVYHLRGLRLEGASGFSRKILTVLEKFTSALSHKVLSVSHSLQEEYLNLNLTNAQKIVTLGHGSSNGVDLHRFDPDAFDTNDLVTLRRDLGLKPDLPVLGFVGRLAVDKGLYELAEARNTLVRMNLPHQFLLIGGVESTPVSSTLEESAQDFPYPFRTTGHIDDPAKYYQLLDILLLPTYREGFPNVVLEAAAAHVPAITTNATGARDSVIHEETGLIVPMRSSSALVDAIIKLLENPELVVVFGENAYKRAKNEFDQSFIWNLLTSFYHKEI